MQETYHTMPMQLPESSLGEMLLSCRNIMALREILDDLLTKPAPWEDPGLGIREAPFQVGYDSIVSWLLAEVVRVLEVDLLVSAA